MYARRVTMEIKPDSRKDFAQKLESEILPLLRKQKGFKDEMTFINADGKNGFAISLWDSKESAEAYSHAPFAEVNKILSKLVEGTPKVKTYEVVNSTCHNIAAKLKAA